MPIKAKKSHKLSDSDRSILLEIFDKTPRPDTGVDALKFRAQHPDSIEDLERLEQWGYLRRDQKGNYLVSLPALAQLESPKTQEILRIAELTFGFFKEWYGDHVQDQVKVSAIAEKIGVEVKEVQDAIVYMLQVSWHAGYTTDLYSVDAAIGANESVVRNKNFQELIDQQQYWCTQRATNNAAMQRSDAYIAQSISDEYVAPPSQPPVQPFPKAPKEVKVLFDEVKKAQHVGLLALTAMGVRATIETVCVKLVGDKGSYQQNLEALAQAGYIQAKEVGILLAAVKVGSASIHRQHLPSQKSINLCVDILEHLLKSVYVLHPASEALNKTTPNRVPRKK